MSADVTLFEMGPRDGLQNERGFISTDLKIRMVDLLSDCGLSKIEVTSFVSSKWVPQLADAKDVMDGINRKDGISYTALTPNMKGFEGALGAKADEIAVFASASDGFSQKNINCSVKDSLERFRPVLTAANHHGLPVRGYVSCITNCPYDGEVSPKDVSFVVSELLSMGCYEVSLGDTIGAATPDKVDVLLKHLSDTADIQLLAGHFHDTKGMALSNIDICLNHGIKIFDSAIGGLGGCPYAPGAKGNVSTESVHEFLTSRGYTTGIDEEKLKIASAYIQDMKSNLQ